VKTGETNIDWWRMLRRCESTQRRILPILI